MRQAADILASPAAMQIRQLESLQAMAKTSAAKVIFVPMNLTDLSSPTAKKQLAEEDSVGPSGSGSGSTGGGMTMGSISQMQQLSSM
jgi:erythrocyte band 7 integral membrane protein